MRPYRIKLAETESEREQIHALNYATFVEEIPQHPRNAERRLVNRFDAENACLIVQVALMGRYDRRALRTLPDAIGRAVEH